MRSEEVNDIFRLAINAAGMGILCVLLFFLMTSARSLYSRENWISTEGSLLREKAEDYLFEYGENVTGNDVVEFILKHDNAYDYYITVNNRTYPITHDMYLSLLQNPSMLPVGESDATCLWSQNYLVNTVMGNAIYGNFFVTIDNTQSRKIYRFVAQ